MKADGSVSIHADDRAYKPLNWMSPPCRLTEDEDGRIWLVENKSGEQLRITIEEIQKRVAEHYNIRLADMHSARRSVAIARPRQVAMYLAKTLTIRSLPEIGRIMGGRDHTTILHGVRKITRLMVDDAALGRDIAEITARLVGDDA